MEVVVNGKPEILAAQMTLADFVLSKGFNPAVIVIEYNQKIAGNGEWDKVVLKNGDKLEIISFVGGG